MCCSRLTANTGRRQKSPSWHHRTTSSGYIFATKACIDNRKKNLLSSNTSSTCAYNMVNFGPLAAEIVCLVWGTPANFNGFRVLAALLHDSQVVHQPHFAALNTGRHLCSAGRPSGWALAHILVCFIMALPMSYGRPLYFCPVVSSSFFFLFFPCQISAVTDWMSTILPHTVWP